MFPKEARLAALERLFGATHALGNNIYVRLATNVPAGPPEDVELADLTECGFDGYDQIANPSFDAAEIDGDGRGSILSEELTWTAGASIISETVRSIYVVMDTGGPESLLFWAELSPYVAMETEGQELTRQLLIKDDNLSF